MELFDIVMAINGPVQPTGDHGIDQVRLKNMKSLTLLTDRLLYEISGTVPCADRCEMSMKAIGQHAKEFMRNVGRGWGAD